MLDGNERGRNVPDVFLLVCSLAVFNGFHLYFSRSFCSFALVNKKKESMKTLVYIVTCVVMLSVISCTSRNKGGDDVQVLMKDSTVISAPQRMQVSDTKVTITYKGREYRSSVVRRPDESLPVVTDEQGERFIDNSIALAHHLWRKTDCGQGVYEGKFRLIGRCPLSEICHSGRTGL